MIGFITAEDVTRHTLVGFSEDEGYPVQGGNCFSVKGFGYVRNARLENFEEWCRRNPGTPLTVVSDDEGRTCRITDTAFPKDWMTEECPRCLRQAQTLP